LLSTCNQIIFEIKLYYLNFVLLLIHKLIFCHSFFNVNDKMKTVGNIKQHDMENIMNKWLNCMTWKIGYFLSL
jgi:hypothetical protein